MVSLPFFFMFCLVLFGTIGAMRGWAKEMLVTFSVVLASFILSVLERYVPFVRDSFAAQGSLPQFWLRFVILVLLVFFGYQTPNLSRIAGARFAREKLQDTLLGLVLGVFNGYLVVGTLWYFMYQANYPFPNYILPPDPATKMGQAALAVYPWLPPQWLGIPTVYFAVAIAFVFVLVVFL
jgi:uncharacterized membrane protein required for colicin V production